MRTLNDREMDCATWGAELGAGYVTEGLSEAYEHVLGLWARTPRWRFIKRGRLDCRAHAILDCYFGIGGYVRRQERLVRGYRDQVDNGSDDEGMDTEPEGGLGFAFALGLVFLLLIAAAFVLVAITGVRP